MEITKHLKSAAWTEAEVGAVVVGAIAGQRVIHESKLFAKHYAENPMWFGGGREGAPFHIKHFGALKAGAAVFASTYINNPWLKLVLMGVAVSGTVEELRVLTWDKNKQGTKVPQIGASTTQLDAELKALSENYRMHGPQYVGDAGDRYGTMVAGYESAVAGPRYVGNAGDRYGSMVAGIDEMGEPVYVNGPFSTTPDDNVQAA